METQLEERFFPLSSSVELIRVPEDGVSKAWPLAAPLLEKAVNRTEKVTLSGLRESMILGDMQLWLVYDTKLNDVLAACGTELSTYVSGFKTARVLLLGGLDLDRWSSLTANFEKWAKQEGCDAVEMVGRKGWGKIFPDYEPIEHWFAKEIR